MKSAKPATRAEIVTAVTKRFRCFGGGRTEGAEWNPLVSVLADDPPTFAAGVDVEDVVTFVMRMAKKGRKKS